MHCRGPALEISQEGDRDALPRGPASASLDTIRENAASSNLSTTYHASSVWWVDARAMDRELRSTCSARISFPAWMIHVISLCQSTYVIYEFYRILKSKD